MPKKVPPKIKGSSKRKYVKGVGDPTKLKKPNNELTPDNLMMRGRPGRLARKA